MPGATTLTPPGNRETVREQAAAPTHYRPAGHLTVVFVRHNCLWLRCRPPSSALTFALLAGCVHGALCLSADLVFGRSFGLTQV